MNKFKRRQHGINGEKRKGRKKKRQVRYARQGGQTHLAENKVDQMIEVGAWVFVDKGR